MSDLLTTPELSTKRAVEPAKRWRNRGRFLCTVEAYCIQCGKQYKHFPGTVHDGCCRTWPSKDLAETFAAEHPTPDVEYLGAVEVSE